MLLILFALGFLATGYSFFKRKVEAASVMMAALLVVFVFIRNHIRDLYLHPFRESFSVLGKNTQYSVMILFFLALVLALGLLVWIFLKVGSERRSFDPASR